jgi:crossover junction endodeoxyribonuclease RusA
MIELPFPPAELSPNARKHWAAKMPVKNKYKADCYYLATQWKPMITGFIHLKFVFHPPSNRGFDLDNSLARIKAGIDGVAEAWGVNDKTFRPITVDFGDVVKGGKVVLTVVEGE